MADVAAENRTGEQALAGLLELSDEQLKNVQMVMPWQPASTTVDRSFDTDADGFPLSYASGKEIDSWSRERSQRECWRMFQRNPQVNTSVRGITGRIAGWGFETSSMVPEIQAAIEEIDLDWRNRLYSFVPKFITRANTEGELFLILTAHYDGFIEVDFLDPLRISAGGDDDSGIIFHPKKDTLPVFYNVSDISGNSVVEQIPSIFVARDPRVVEDVAGHTSYDESKQRRVALPRFRQIGGYQRFVVSWDKGLITRRAVSYLRTTIEWLNHYEQLKKYEIDHKKSSGAYAWVFTFEDPKAFKLWASLTDDQRKSTGMMSTIVPGARLFVPPGIAVKAVSPQLPKISDTDTDILEMAASGMNEPRDTMTGTAKGTYGGIRASRGPMSDRTSDEIAYFDRWWRYDFWGSIFFLKAAMGFMRPRYEVEEAVGFKNQEPVFGKVLKRPEQLVEVDYPTSESIDYESRAKGLMGTKHGPVTETLGVSKKSVARRMGIGGYGRQRLQKATEDKLFPKLLYTQDDEKIQEVVEGEKGKQGEE
jgi:hypothetical protein